MENFKLFVLIFVTIVILVFSSIRLTMRVANLEHRARYIEGSISELLDKVYENSIRIDEITEESWTTPND